MIGQSLNQQDIDHEKAWQQKMELDGVVGGWSAWLHDTLTDHAEIYREAAEAGAALRAASESSEAVALAELDEVATRPYRQLLAAAREMIAVEDECGIETRDDLTRQQFNRRESAWSELRELCAKGGGQ